MAVDKVCIRGEIQTDAIEEAYHDRCAELCAPQSEILLVKQAIKLNTMQADGLLGLSPSGS